MDALLLMSLLIVVGGGESIITGTSVAQEIAGGTVTRTGFAFYAGNLTCSHE